MVARLRARLAQEDGMTLVELLTSMTVLALVLTGVLAMFTSGLGAETDMNTRFQSQQNARLALEVMRSDIGDACSATGPAGPTGTANFTSAASFTLSEPSAAATSLGSCSTGTTSVSWCAASANGTQPFALYRAAAGTCSAASGVDKVGSLTMNTLFTSTCTAGSHQLLTVTLPVNANLSDTHTVYRLGDTIMLHNSSVASSC
jgi:prepilin-type N-terminal cleavage/methylation domain-containing protein